MSSLSQKEKLQALGVKAASVQNNPYLSEFEAIENYGFSQFQTDVNGQADYSEFESYLQSSIGLSSTKAVKVRSRMEQKYDDFPDFQTTLGGFSDIDEWINSFSWGTTLTGGTTGPDGQELSGGIRVHGEAGVSYDGVNVEAGTVEIFGPRIETSNTGAASAKTSSFTTTNLTISDQTPDTYEDITISADVQNDNSYSDTATVKLTEDGEVVQSKAVDLAGGAFKTVTFTRTYTDLVSVEVKVNEAGPQTVTVVPPGLVEPEDL